MTAQQQPHSPAAKNGRPNLAGDLNSILGGDPAFSLAMRGYDRLQVDNYVAWAETELRAAHRVNSELLTRLAASEVERQRTQQLLELSEHSRDVVRVTDRVAELLRLAAQEAAAVAAAGAAEAGQAGEIVAGAQERADLILRRAKKQEAQVAARLQSAERTRSEAEAAVERARTEVGDMLAEAQDQLSELHRRQDRVHELLAGLVHQVDAALEALAGEGAPEFSFGANRAEARDRNAVAGASPAGM